MSIAYNEMPIEVTASSKIILLTNTIFQYNTLTHQPDKREFAHGHWQRYD